MNNNSQFLLADLVEEMKTLNKKLSRSNKIHEEGYQKIADAIYGKKQANVHAKGCCCQSSDPLDRAMDKLFQEILDEQL